MPRGRNWTPEMDRDLLSVKFTPTQKRVHGRGSGFDWIARKYGKTRAACAVRYHVLRQRSGLKGAWVTEGLWEDWEDEMIWSRIGTGRVPDGTWPDLAALLPGRTLSAVHTRASNLRRGKVGRIDHLVKDPACAKHAV